MSDYDPSILAAKWTIPLSDLLAECQQLWERERPRGWFGFGARERDSSRDQATPAQDIQLLVMKGRIVFGQFARAFFPAYIPGSQTHYGSVVYSTDPARSGEVFDLAWRVNELRRAGGLRPAGTEQVAAAINDDQSDFSRIHLPVELGIHPGCYFANICIHRSRLPLGYIHTRLVPILIAPELTQWCALLPLRAWSVQFQELWKSGAPAYPHGPFLNNCRQFNIIP